MYHNFVSSYQQVAGSREWALYRLRMTSDTLANTTLTSLVSTAVV